MTVLFRWLSVVGVLLLSLSLEAAEKSGFVEPAADHAIVAGFERFFEAAGKTAPNDVASGGRLLLGELGCIACHAADGAAAKQIAKKQAPVLDGVGSRVRLSFITKASRPPLRGNVTGPGKASDWTAPARYAFPAWSTATAAAWS